MSLILRSRGSLPNGLFLRPNVCHTALFNSTDLSRRYVQVARKEEEVKYDPRGVPIDYEPATFDHTEHLNLSTECVWRLVDKIPGLKFIEVAELGSIMMKKVGMKIPPTVSVMKPGAGLAGTGAMKGMAAPEMIQENTAFELKSESFDAPAETKLIKEIPEETAFELKLESFDAAAKIKLIKEIRSCTCLGLMEAKYLVDNIPSVFKKGVSKEEGDIIIEKMKALGAKVVMETNEFELKLESFDAPAKIRLIKEVRWCTDLGVKEIKHLVENVPSVFKKGVSREEGEKIIEKMKALGAKVVMEKEKNEFALKLRSFYAPEKIKLIKVVTWCTGLGLKEAKRLVDNVPSVFKKGVSKEEGEFIIEKMKALGARVVMEKNEFELKLESFDPPAKINLIKEVRSCTDLGLKKAKDLVENVPSVFKRGVPKEEGEKILEKMKALGAKVVMVTNEFDLKLESFDALPAKIKLIKEVRWCTDLSLREAKDLVENIPSVFKRGVSRNEGERIIEKMKALGAKVVMEKYEFALKLESFDAPAKIKLIKEVIRYTGLGFKEAKDLVDNVPSVFKKRVSKEEGEDIIGKMKALGAKVVME